jgi:hypothetical protein
VAERVHYAELRKPLDATEFIDGLRKRLDDGLTRLDTALARGTSGGVRIITRQGSPWVSVPKLDKLPEPRNLGALKAEVERRWGTNDLLDILKDTAFITGFTEILRSKTACPCRRPALCRVNPDCRQGTHKPICGSPVEDRREVGDVAERRISPT